MDPLACVPTTLACRLSFGPPSPSDRETPKAAAPAPENRSSGSSGRLPLVFTTPHKECLGIHWKVYEMRFPRERPSWQDTAVHCHATKSARTCFYKRELAGNFCATLHVSTAKERCRNAKSRARKKIPFHLHRIYSDARCFGSGNVRAGSAAAVVPSRATRSAGVADRALSRSFARAGSWRCDLPGPDSRRRALGR